jgi:hypothetical protein
MLLADLVATSAAVKAVSGRLDKIGRLATLLQSVSGDEARIAVAFLSGSIRQGRLGIGGAALREARDISPADSSISPSSTSIVLREMAATPDRRRASAAPARRARGGHGARADFRCACSSANCAGAERVPSTLSRARPGFRPQGCDARPLAGDLSIVAEAAAPARPA